MTHLRGASKASSEEQERQYVKSRDKFLLEAGLSRFGLKAFYASMNLLGLMNAIRRRLTGNREPA